MTSKTETQLARLEDMLTRLETLEAGARLPALPSPLVFDAYGNPGAVAPGDLIESAWGNAVKDRVLHRFPTKTALDAWHPGAATLAVTTDLNVVWFYDSSTSTWLPTGVGNRMTFRSVGDGTQLIPTGTPVRAHFVESSDPFSVVSGSVFTVPAGWPGRWHFEWSCYFATTVSSGNRQVYAQIGGSTHGAQAISGTGSGAVQMSGSASPRLVVGDTAEITMFQDSGGDLNVNPTANQYFAGHYVGPA